MKTQILAVVLAAGAYLTVRAARQLTVFVARSLETIRKLTTQDMLTGLPNRRVILERLDAMLATRRARFVALALIDIDGFMAGIVFSRKDSTLPG